MKFAAIVALIALTSACNERSNKVKALTKVGLSSEEREALRFETLEAEKPQECSQLKAETECLNLILGDEEENNNIIAGSIQYSLSGLLEEKNIVTVEYRTCKFFYKAQSEEDESPVGFIGNYFIENNSDCTIGGGETEKTVYHPEGESTGETDVDLI